MISNFVKLVNSLDMSAHNSFFLLVLDLVHLGLLLLAVLERLAHVGEVRHLGRARGDLLVELGHHLLQLQHRLLRQALRSRSRRE